MHFRRILRVWTSFTQIHRTVEAVWNGVFEEHVSDLPESQIEQGGEQNWKNPGDPPFWRESCGMKSHGLFWHMLQIWPSIAVVEEWSRHFLGPGM